MQDPNLIPVKYIGIRPTYVDGTYGTRINWTQGETQLVPAAKAKLMLRHPDVYVPGDVDAPAAVAEVKPEQEKKEDEHQEMRDAVALMDKATLEQFAKTHFRVDLNKRKGVETLRTEVIGLIDQLGVA